MIVAGTVTYKMAEVVRRIYDQMEIPNGSSPWVALDWRYVSISMP